MADRTLHSLLTGISRPPHSGAFLIIGLGHFGTALGRTLVEMDQEVLAVDLDPDRVQQHAHELTQVVQANATSAAALRQLGAADLSTAVVCIGDVEASILTTAALVDLGVANIWAKASTTAHGTILTRVGCHHVVFPEVEMGGRVAHLLTGTMLEYVALDDDFAIVETAVPAELDGVAVGAGPIAERYGITVVCVKPSGQPYTAATGDTVVRTGEVIVIAGQRESVERFANAH